MTLPGLKGRGLMGTLGARMTPVAIAHNPRRKGRAGPLCFAFQNATFRMMESSILVKAFALLEATAQYRSTNSLGELAAAVGLSKPTAHRILKTLTSLGYIERFDAGRYRQTHQVLRLVAGAEERRLREAAESILQRLHDSTCETVNLGVLRQTKVLYLQVLESTQPLRRVAEPNSVDPFYSTALGRAIVAHLSPEQRNLLLRSVKPEKRTAVTVTCVDELRRILEEVAEQGIAVEKDQTDLGVTCIGAPIFDGRIPVAAISLSIPSARCNEAYEKELIAAVRAAAGEVTRRLAASSEAEQ